MLSSPGKSSRRRCAICCGLHAIAHRRLCRGPCRRPFHAPSGQAPWSRPEWQRRQPADPAHTFAAPGCPPASHASADAPTARRATARCSPGSPGCRLAWPRCDAAPETRSMPTAPGGAPPPGCSGPAPATARSAPAPQRRDNAWKAAPTTATGETAPSHPPHGTNGCRPAAILPPPSPRPRSTSRRRSTPRTAAGVPATPPEAGQATSACHAKPDPNDADPPSHPPPPIRCCDDRLKPPWLPWSL